MNHSQPPSWHKHPRLERIPKETRQIQGEGHRIYAPCEYPCHHNPSPVVLSGELLCNIRVSHDRHTRNYLGRVVNWNLTSSKYLHNDWVFGEGGHLRVSPDPRWQKVEVEDLRLFHNSYDELLALAAVHEGGNDPQNIRQGLFFIKDGALTEAEVFPANRLEKNWLPHWRKDQPLRFVYSCDPLVTLTYTGRGQVMPSPLHIPKGVSYIRGSTQLLPFGKNGWIAIVHQVYKPPVVKTGPAYNPLLGGWPPFDPDPLSGVAPTVYVHHFALFDHDVTAVKLGPPFYFRHLGIEFCCGAAWWNNALVAGVGVEEREAWLVEIPREEVERLLP